MKAQDTQRYTDPDIDLSAFRYDPETGIVHRTRDSGRAHAGDPVGTLNHHGYLQATIEGRYVAVHRLAWRLLNGAWPQHRIDHEDRDKTNNRPGNMRPATNGENARNRTAQANNTTGYKGVIRDDRQPAKPFVAVIEVDGKRQWLGSYETAEHAAWAYDRACRRHHGRYGQPNGIPFPGRSVRAKRGRGGLGYEGVAVRVQKDRIVYRALGTLDGKRVHIGTYVSAYWAALAYDDWLTANGIEGRRYNFPLIRLGRVATSIFDDFHPVRA